MHPEFISHHLPNMIWGAAQINKKWKLVVVCERAAFWWAGGYTPPPPPEPPLPQQLSPGAEAEKGGAMPARGGNTSVAGARSQRDDVSVPSWPLIVGMSPLNPL